MLYHSVLREIFVYLVVILILLLIQIWIGIMMNLIHLLYTWLKANSNNMSGARLDRFYVVKGNRGRFFSSSISPSFLSDHHYVSIKVSVSFPRFSKSHWHFNNRLLQDCTFIHSFNLFWKTWREERCSFQSLTQW